MHGFLRRESHIVCMCTFLAFMDGACACAPYVVIAHADFVTSCIALDLLEILCGHFWSMGELIVV